MTDTADLICEFKNALLELDDQEMLDRFYYGRPAAKLPPNTEPQLRRAISQKFQVSMRDVLVTGSAKVGFTTVPKPEKSRPIFSPFGDESDVDVAIISQELFVKFWRSATEFSDDPEWRHKKQFRAYLSRGWIRPDMLPSNDQFRDRLDWFEKLRKIRNRGIFGEYSISAGVYYDELFWERYACKALHHCRLYRDI